MFPARKQRIESSVLGNRFPGFRIHGIDQGVSKIIILITAVGTDIMPVAAFGIRGFVAVRLQPVMMLKFLKFKLRFFLFIFLCRKGGSRHKGNHHAQAQQQRNNHSFLHKQILPV